MEPVGGTQLVFYHSDVKLMYMAKNASCANEKKIKV